MSELLSFLCENDPQFRRSRLPALYSDFRQLQKTNPDGYVANVSAWLQGLAAAARAGVMPATVGTPDLLSITLNQDLLKALETENGRPLALGIAIQEGIDKGQLYDLSEFMDSHQSIYHKSWVVRPLDILAWGWKQLGMGNKNNDDSLFKSKKFVFIENLEIAGKQAQKIFDHCRGRVDRVFAYAAFAKKIEHTFGPDTILSDHDIEVLLRYLARDKGLICYDSKTVKLKSPNEAGEITSDDTTLASLRTLIIDLETQISALSARLIELSDTAKDAVLKKNRSAALAALRSKKLTETALKKRHATLAQLEDVLFKIDQAANLVELANVMEASTEVLTGLNKEIGGVKRVEDVVDKLQEQMELVDEVGRVTELGQSIDSEDIDNELDVMEKEEKEQRERIEESEIRLKLDKLREVELQMQMANQEGSIDHEIERDLAASTEGLKILSLASRTKLTD